MDNVKAATVAMSLERIVSMRSWNKIVATYSSGQIMVDMIEAGTTIPPIPRPEMMSRTYESHKLSRLRAAKPPPPAVIMMLETNMSSRMRPLV